MKILRKWRYYLLSYMACDKNGALLYGSCLNKTEAGYFSGAWNKQHLEEDRKLNKVIITGFQQITKKEYNNWLPKEYK